MPPQQQQEPSMLLDLRTSFNIANFLADTHSACIRPFTRTGMGARGLGAPAFFAAILILAYAGNAHAPDMLLYFQAWLVMVVYRRITADKTQHSHFQGWVWMFDWCVKNELTARLLEAGSMWIIGGILSGFSEAIGRFVSAGVFSLGLKYLIDASTVQRQKEAAHNARIEMAAMQRRLEEEKRW
jgi:hypothetical protein